MSKQKKKSGGPGADGPASAGIDALALRHFRIGWRALLFFVTLGLFLEAMHGFKIGAYLNVSNETRRFMWTLAHAHGGLIAILQIAFGATISLAGNLSSAASILELASRCFFAALVLMPLGFFLGGLFIHSGDPGLGILLAPAGAGLLIVAVVLTARALGSGQDRP